MKKKENFFVTLTLIIFLLGCNSFENIIDKSYKELTSNQIEFTKSKYNKRCNISDIEKSLNEIEIRRYELYSLSQTMNLICFSKRGKECYSKIFAESNVPKRKIHNINTSKLNSCELIEELLKNNIHKLTDYNIVYDEITKKEPLPFIRTDGTSYFIQVKIRDKIYEMTYGDFETELKLFPENIELIEYKKISDVFDSLEL